VLELARETDICLNIELKNNWVAYPGMEERVVALVERYHMAERVILSSFNHNSLKQLSLLKPSWSLAALYDCKLVEPWQYARLIGVNSLHPHYRSVDEEMVQTCQRHGIGIRPYTVDEERDIKRLLAAGVEAIITNHPDRVQKLARHGAVELLPHSEDDTIGKVERRLK
jgi:glycerophosphoryl diester phosphodiesterase